MNNNASRHDIGSTLTVEDGLVAGLIAVAILIAMTTLGADLTDPFGEMNAQATAAPHFA